MVTDQRPAAGDYHVAGSRRANALRYAHQVGSGGLEQAWQLYDDAFQPCYDLAVERAKYQWYWHQRTGWLIDHASEAGTARFQERRAKRLGMTDRMNAIELEFVRLAFLAQECARWNLGEPHCAEILERYGVDYRRVGQTLDIFAFQWREHMTWNPEQPPF